MEKNNKGTSTVTKATVPVNEEVNIEEIVNVELTGTEEFDNATTFAYEMIQIEFQRNIVLYTTTPIQKQSLVVVKLEEKIAPNL